MTPDIKIKDFYLKYIHNAKRDLENYRKLEQAINESILLLYNQIKENKDKILETFNINVEQYESEYINMIYNETECLYLDVVNKLKTTTEQDKSLLILLVKYCVKLKEEYKNKIKIIVEEKKTKLKFTEYKKLVTEYFLKVHKFVLEGYGYKFSNGIGTYIINYYKIDNPTKNAIDFAETNKRKKELLSKGYKLYDDREATWYKERNIPYDGVEYRVYLDKKFYYDFTFINSKVFHKKELDYQRTEYVHAKLRGMSYQDMADKFCNNVEDIINLNVDIKYKLNILLYKYPDKYLNFVRNAEATKYKY